MKDLEGLAAGLPTIQSRGWSDHSAEVFRSRREVSRRSVAAPNPLRVHRLIDTVALSGTPAFCKQSPDSRRLPRAGAAACVLPETLRGSQLRCLRTGAPRRPFRTA